MIIKKQKFIKMTELQRNFFFCIKICLLLFIFFYITACKPSSSAPMSDSIEPIDDTVEIHVNVITVSSLQYEEINLFLRWLVELRVNRILKGTPNIQPNETITVQVHSVASTFHCPIDTILGKTFTIQYLEPFEKDYKGLIFVTPQ